MVWRALGSDRRWPIPLALAAALLVSACGGDNDEASAGSAASSAAASLPVAGTQTPLVEPAASGAGAESAVAVPAPTPAPALAPETPVANAIETPAADAAGTPPAETAETPANAIETLPADAAGVPPAETAEAPPPAAAETPAVVAEVSPAPDSAAGAVPLVTAADEPPLSPEMAAMIAAGDPEAGRSYAQRCVGCHSMREEQTVGGPQSGPVLFGVFEAQAGAQSDFAYSPALVGMHDAGLSWTAARLNAFLSDPAAAAPGTSMTIGAIRDDQARANVIAYLKTLQPEPDTNGATNALVTRITGADLADGEALATGRCSSCHSFAQGGAAIVGPNLYDIVGAPVAAAEGFNYSQALRALGDEGAEWTFDRLDAFLANPAITVPGTRMGFAGIANPDDRAAVIAYLRTLSENPASLGDGRLGIGVYQPDLTPLIFGNGQAQIGQSKFGTFACDACHDPGLLGGVAGMGGAVPPLVGLSFEEKWFSGTVYALFDHLAQHAAQEAADIADSDLPFLLAYILSRNGFQPGDQKSPAGSRCVAGHGILSIAIPALRGAQNSAPQICRPATRR